MAIELLTVCQWNLPQRGYSELEFLRPTWSQIETAIRDLDEHVYNDLYLHPEASNLETYLAVGGGNGRYLVSGNVNNERFPTAVKCIGDDANREMLMVGGQTGDYPSAWILDLDSALRAAQSFFETGNFGGGGLMWVDA